MLSQSCAVQTESNVHSLLASIMLRFVSSTRSTDDTNKLRPPLHLDAMFAAYASLLIAFAVVCKPPYAWDLPHRYFYMWHPKSPSISLDGFLLTYVVFFLIPAIAVFVSVVAVEHFRSTLKALRVFTGFIAVAGFPLVCLYALPRIFGACELLVSICVLILWTRERWPVSDGFNVVLLILHFAFWLSFCVSLLGLALRQTSSWGLWDYLVFVYPTVGLAYSLMWAKDSKNRSSWR